MWSASGYGQTDALKQREYGYVFRARFAATVPSRSSLESTTTLRKRAA
jgi:hypothetical protein